MSKPRFEDEQKRLATLPRAERFEELLSFPCSHDFKIIGQPDGLTERVMAAMAQAGHDGAVPRERPSGNGKWLAVTVEIRAQSGQELDALYAALEKLEGVKYLF